MTENKASSPTTFPLFLLKEPLERTRLRGCSAALFSPLASVVSGTRYCCCSTESPCVNLSNTSSSFEVLTTQKKRWTHELRSHTEEFRKYKLVLSGPKTLHFSSNTTERQRHQLMPCGLNDSRRGNSGALILNKETESTTWSQRGVIFEEYSFGTKFTLIESVLQ